MTEEQFDRAYTAGWDAGFEHAEAGPQAIAARVPFIGISMLEVWTLGWIAGLQTAARPQHRED